MQVRDVPLHTIDLPSLCIGRGARAASSPWRPGSCVSCSHHGSRSSSFIRQKNSAFGESYVSLVLAGPHDNRLSNATGRRRSGQFPRDTGPVTFVDWTEPVRLLETELLPATEDQLALASFVGLHLSDDLPRGVAAVILEDALRPRISGTSAESAPADLQPTDRQMEFLRGTAHGELWTRAVLSRRSASAWIGHFLAERTAHRLRETQLIQGDRVTKTSSWVDEATGELHEWSQEYEVSSIGANGLVYFRGGNGQCGWPSSLTRAKSPPVAPSGE